MVREVHRFSGATQSGTRITEAPAMLVPSLLVAPKATNIASVIIGSPLLSRVMIKLPSPVTPDFAALTQKKGTIKTASPMTCLNLFILQAPE
jgi:hypothetical protein